MPKWKRPSILRRRQPEIRFLDETPQPSKKRRRFWHRLRPRWPRRLRFVRLRRWLGRLFAFLRRINPLRSLWFKLVGAFVAVLLIMLFSVLSVISSVTSQAFSAYASARNSYIQAVIPALVPPPQALPEMPEMPEMPEIPEMPEMPVMPETPWEDIYPAPIPDEFTPPDAAFETVVQPDFATNDVVIVADGRVFVDPVVLEPVLELVQIDVGSDRYLAFLDEVRDGTQRAVLIAGIAAIFLGTLLFRQITRPLARIRTASQALAEGDLSARVPVKSRDELGKVGTAFNQMASEIEKQDRLRQQMVADVAHELRTPVTVMQANLEAMLDGILEADDAELQELHDEVRRLSRMIEDLRLLSLADAGQLSLRQEPLPVADLVDTVVARLQPLAQAEEIELEADAISFKLFVQGDGDRLEQALGNLIDNSIRYTPPGGRVRVTAVREADLVHISVADTGPGISPADLPTIFERFWRGDRSRSRHSGGSGLGLSIVQQVATLHGGSVRVASPPGAGAIFTISLPLHRD